MTINDFITHCEVQRADLAKVKASINNLDAVGCNEPLTVSQLVSVILAAGSPLPELASDFAMLTANLPNARTTLGRFLESYLNGKETRCIQCARIGTDAAHATISFFDGPPMGFGGEVTSRLYRTEIFLSGSFINIIKKHFQR